MSSRTSYIYYIYVPGISFIPIGSLVCPSKCTFTSLKIFFLGEVQRSLSSRESQEYRRTSILRLRSISVVCVSWMIPLTLFVSENVITEGGGVVHSRLQEQNAACSLFAMTTVFEKSWWALESEPPNRLDNRVISTTFRRPC